MNLRKSPHIASLLIVAMALAVNGYSQSFLTNGLVAYYPFAGDANDASGNGLDGTVHGAALTTDRFGNANQAFRFDGVASYLITPLSSAVFDGDFSASLWFHAYDIANAWPTLLREQNGSLLMGIVGQTSGTLQPDHIGDFIAYSSYAPATFSWFLERYQQTALDTFINVVLTKSGTDVAMYWNGQVVVSGQVAPPITQPGSYLTIGRSIDNEDVVGNSAFHGEIDDIRIYNRALSSGEVAELYGFEAVPEPGVPSLLGVTLASWLIIRRKLI